MNLAQNTIWSFASKFVAMIFYMLLDVLLARILGVEDYAEWVFFYSVLTMLFYFGWMGINSSVKVFVSKEENSLNKRYCITASVQLRLLYSIIAALIIFFVAPRLSEILGYPDKYKHLQYLMLSSSILVFLNSFSEFFKELSMGLEKFKMLFCITFLEYGGYFLFVLLFLYISRSIYGIVWGYVCSGICVVAFGVYILKKYILIKKEDFILSLKRYALPIVKYAVPIAIISFGGLILIEMDTFMLGILSKKEDVAVYGIAKNLCSKATHINYALTVGTMTTFSVFNRKDYADKIKKFMKVSNLNLAVTLVISIVFLVIGPFAINIIYGKQYMEAGRVLRALTPYYALYGISNFYSVFLDFQGKAKFRSFCYISIIILNFSLNYILIQIIGATVEAIATSISLIPYTILVVWGTIKSIKRIEAINME